MRFIRYLILGLIVFYLEVLLTPKFMIAGIVPTLVLGYVIFASINLNLLESASLSFIIGLALDLLNPVMLGTNCIVLLVLTYIISKFQGMITKDKPAPVIISIVLVNSIYLIMIILLKTFMFGFNIIRLKIFVPELLYNCIVTIVVLAVLVLSKRMRIVINN